MFPLANAVKRPQASGAPTLLSSMPAFPSIRSGNISLNLADQLQYFPSSITANFRHIINEYRRLSVVELERHDHLVHRRYGDDADEVVVLTGAVTKAAPVHIFIHGGYWQELSWRDAFFPAGGFSAAGVTFGALNYSLAPKLTLAAIVEQCRRAVADLAILSLDVGGSGRISLSGSSAGAHLAAMLAMTRWSDFGLNHDPIAALVLVSGIYDLEPLVKTTINAPLQLTRAEARRLSPLRMSTSAPPPCIVCWGEHETEAFKRQGCAYAHRLNHAGADVHRFEAPGRNHFDITFDLSDPATVLGAATLSLIQNTRRH